MRTLRLPALIGILAVPVAMAAPGCSGTLGSRSRLAPQIKTITWVGDKPEPIVAGTPGNAVRSSDPEPARPNDANGRISGRVLDVRGRPVPNARVRLALSGASGGRVVRSTTDASGGFTLHGLRPGGSYTVIAESDDPQGMITVVHGDC